MDKIKLRRIYQFSPLYLSEPLFCDGTHKTSRNERRPSTVYVYTDGLRIPDTGT